jgi:endogenous inhibitor of DNA gyrase (YacG/DUF329 family)
MAFTKEQKRLWRLRPEVQEHEREYQREWNAQNKTLEHWKYLEKRSVAEIRESNCIVCGKSFTTNQPRQQYCSEKCCRRAAYIRQHGWHKPQIEELLSITCERCKTPFQQSMARQRFCCHKCKELDKVARWRSRQSIALEAAREELHIFPTQLPSGIPRLIRASTSGHEADIAHMSLKPATNLVFRCLPADVQLAAAWFCYWQPNPIRDAIWPVLKPRLLSEINAERHARRRGQLTAAYQTVGDLLNTRRK